MTTIRSVQQIITAHQQKEGAGFLVRRPFPTQGLDQVDPFLMLDELGPVDYGPGEAIGAPDHPHRGFETVSYILSGEKLHEDTAGDAQIIHAGDVQWMTAGAGVVHSEMPSPRVMSEGATSHGFQIWVNLPAKYKMIPPKYQYVPKAEIPIGISEDGLIDVTVIAGKAFGVEAKIGTHTPIWLQDWRVQAAGSTEFVVESGHNIAAYVFDGSVSFGIEENVVKRGQLGLFGSGDRMRINPTGSGRFLLLSGQALNEPVARYGPFVMNTREELITAFEDYQAGRMGQISREASTS
jgi:redox-sensitive bicupin YhaK (pirin superfamily)